jgi:hypothetical protein
LTKGAGQACGLTGLTGALILLSGFWKETFAGLKIGLCISYDFSKPLSGDFNDNEILSSWQESLGVRGEELLVSTA